MTDNQPRYTTARLREEVAKAKAYARREALEEAAKVADGYAADNEAIAPHYHAGVSIASSIRALLKEEPTQ